MKKILVAALLVPAMALAQTYPSPTFNSVTLQNPLATSMGGTGATTSTGTGATVLSAAPTLTAPNLGTPSSVTLTNGTGLPISTGVSGLGTGVATSLGNAVTGSGSPVLATSPTIASPTVTGAFTATGIVTTSDLATQAANTILANGTSSSASPTAIGVPSCSTSVSALNWTSGAGFSCNAALITASTVSSTYAPLASPTFTGTPSLPTGTTAVTQAQFDNSTKLATTASVKASGFEYAGTNGIGISTTTTVTLAQLNSWAQFQANVTATLPLVSTVPGGATMTFIGGSTGGTVKGNGSDSILDANGISANTLYVPVGQTVVVDSNGSGAWYVTSTGKTRVPLACQSILDYGGAAGGVVDNTAAFAATIAAAGSSTGACVYFPPGTYAFASSAAYTFANASASLTIRGDGPDISVLQWASGGGIDVNYIGNGNSVHIRNVTLATGTTNTGSAIFLNILTSTNNPQPAALSDISSVSIRGSDGYAKTNYWQNGIAISGVSDVNFINDNIVGQGTSPYATNGNGILISGSSSQIPVQYNVIGSVINYVGIGLNYGTYTQGVSVANTNFVGDNYGISASSGETALDQLSVTGSQFNCGTTDINLATKVPGLSIQGNFFLMPNSAFGISLTGTPGQYSIVSNSFNPTSGSPTGVVGINISNSAGPGIISGNSFASLNTAIALQSTSTLVNVQANVYQSNTTNVFNSGTGNSVGVATQ